MSNPCRPVWFWEGQACTQGRSLSRKGHCVSKPWLSSNGVMLVPCQQQLFMYHLVPIPSHPSCPHWDLMLQRPLPTYSPLLGHLPILPPGLHALSRPLCITIVLAPVEILLEMRQLSSRQQGDSKQKHREQGWEKSQQEGWCREAKLLVPGAGPDMLLAAAATCGGASHILGLQFLHSKGHLVTSCLLPWVPGREKILLGEPLAMGGPSPHADQELGWVCNSLPYVLGLALHTGVVARGFMARA